MKQNASKSKSKSATFGDINAEAPLWILLPKMLSAIAVSTVFILVLFYLQFGELPIFIYGFAAFIAVLQILTVVGLRFQNRNEVHTTVKLRNDWLDKIAAWWLMACAFGALTGWFCGQMAHSFQKFSLAFHGAKIFFTFALPVFTMLPNLRYLERQSAAIQIPLLFFITILPMFVGASSVIFFWNYLMK